MNTKHKIQIIISIILIVLLDQATKYVVLEKIWEYGSIEVTSFFNIVAVWNHGISFGVLNNNDTSQWVLILLSVMIISTLLFQLKDSSSKEKLAYTLIISGAIGNVIDRLNYGAVFDFLDFHIKEWHYPSFNVADIFIVVGVIIWMIFYQK